MPEPEGKQRLTDKHYWDSVHSAPTTASAVAQVGGTSHRRALGLVPRSWLGDYSNWVRWERLYPRFLPKERASRVLEVGSAPGHHLVELHRRWGYRVFGIE